MPKEDAGVSIADVMAAGLRLRPSDAATIVREIALQVARGSLPGVPSAHVIHLMPTGRLSVEGPVVTGGRPVRQAAHLLTALLPPRSKTSASDALPLRRVVERALADSHEGVELLTIGGLAEALAPYAAQDPEAHFREILHNWSARYAPRIDGDASVDDVSVDDADNDGSFGTVSDLRRARRATGIPLAEVARRSRIPLSLLRQLEWGYLRNWPVGLYGRTQLVRYARAAGLDRQMVLGAMWPLVAEEAHIRQRSPADLPAHPPIVIVEPTFAADEVLFEAESELPLEAEAVVDSVPEADRPVSPELLADEIVAEEVGTPQTVIREDVPAIDPVIFRDWPEPASTRRGSTFAAAGLIGTLIAGGIWAARTDDLFLATPRRSPERHVRQLPVHQPPSPSLADPAPRGTAGATHAVTLDGPPLGLPVATTGDVRPAMTKVMDSSIAEDVDDETDSGAFDSAGAPAFSPAGGADAGLPHALRIARILDENSRNYNTQLSPDGTQVAFDSDRAGSRAVYVANADGRHLRRITGEGEAAMPRWSADGRTLAYVSAEADNPSVWNLWSVDVESGQPRRLTSHTSGRMSTGSWFSDGSRIAYARGGQLIVLRTATADEVSYRSPLAGRGIASPAVSPDGQRIIFQVVREGGWILDLADGSMRKVISDPSAGQYTWSPDGAQVAYYSGRDGEWNVWVLAAR